MSYVLMAHAADAQSRADRVAEKLRALGFEVRTPDAVRPADEIEAASAVLVLWSRRAKGAERDFTRAAQRAGKLTIARLDPVTPPVAGGIDLVTWGGRDTRAWSRLVTQLKLKAAPAASGKAKKTKAKAKPKKVAQARAATAPPQHHSLAMMSVGFLVVFATLLGAAAMFTPPH